MDRLNARSAFALLLLLTVLMLTLTCATATAAKIGYIYYDQDGNWKRLEAPIIDELGYCFHYGDDGDVTLNKINPDGPNFYLDRESTLFDVTKINIDEGDVCLVLSYEKDAYPPFYVSDDASLTFYNEEHFSDTRNATSICLGAGSTLNLNSANLNLSGSIRYFPSSSEPAAATATVNMYGGTNTITVSADGEPGIGQGIELNIFGGELFITGGSGQRALNCTSLNFSPSSGSYILVYDGVDKDTRTLIGAYNQSNSDGVLDTLKKYTALSMEKAEMSTIGIDQNPQTYCVDDSPRFEVNVLTDGVSSGSFTVEYKQDGAYSTTLPTQPGTYDVRITRAADETYATVNLVIPGGLKVTPGTIKYTSPEPQTLVYDGEPHSLGVTVTSPADATVTYTSGAGEPIGVPAFTDAGDYTVTYTITKTNYDTETGTLRLTINPFPIACTATGFTSVYDGEAHGVAIADIRLANAAHAAVAYTVNGAPYTGIGAPAFTEAGEYTVGYTVSVPGNSSYTPASGSVSVRISPASQAAPTGIVAVAETIRYKNDGRLTGVTAEMEYRAKDSSTYTAITGTEVAGLAPGTYCVRYKATANHLASGDTQLTVASGRAAYDTDSTQGAKGISADNVLPENEELLRQALNDYQSALDTLGGSFTEAEKQEIQAEMARIRSALETLERAAAVREAIAALPDAVEPDDTGAEAGILAAKAAFDALTAHERALVGDAPAAKLDRLLPMLTAYRIIRGDGASLIAGQNTALGFTANGPLAKLKEVLVDGKALDAKHYTAQSGSTIITLAADYVKTLAVGAHTLTVRYTDGETSARFTVAAMPQDLPQTGDSSRLTGWLALLGACCAGLWCLNRRRA